MPEIVLDEPEVRHLAQVREVIAARVAQHVRGIWEREAKQRGASEQADDLDAPDLGDFAKRGQE